jgi:hypothetical protein
MTMSFESQSALRRRAAVAVLSDVLDETALFEALWMQHDSMRGEAVSDVIGYVDALGSKFMFDAATKKRLYGAFFGALKSSINDLPADPWPKMQAQMVARMAQAKPAPEPVAPPPAPVPVPQPVPLGVPIELQQPRVVLPPASPLPAPAAAPAEPQIIFGAVMRSVLKEIYQYHRDAADTVWTGALAELDKTDVTEAVKMRFSQAWMRPLNDDWIVPGMSLELAELTRIMFVSLTHAFGRNGADQILSRGVVAAERLPEATKFSPKRLLSAL